MAVVEVQNEEERLQRERDRCARYYKANKPRAIARAKRWAEGNPEKRREIFSRWVKSEKGKKYQSRYRKDRPLKYRVAMAQRRAKKTGIEFDITADDLVLPEVCPLLGITIDAHSESSDHWPSLDRLDNTKGYVRGNVLIISYRANRIKSDATAAELQLMARNLFKLMED